MLSAGWDNFSYFNHSFLEVHFHTVASTNFNEILLHMLVFLDLLGSKKHIAKYAGTFWMNNIKYGTNEKDQKMSQVSAVFHTEVTVSIGLKN